MKKIMELQKARKNKKDNSNLLSMLSYFSSLREWGTVRELLRNTNQFTSDGSLQEGLKNLFLTSRHCKTYFGIAEDIVGSMANMVFGGNIRIKVKDENVQEVVNQIYADGYFMKSVINTYKAAIATKGRAYLFMETTTEYIAQTESFDDGEFVKYNVVPEFELKINDMGRNVIRPIFKEVLVEDEYKTFRFDYKYYIGENNETELYVEGYDDNERLLDERAVREILGIEFTYVKFDFIPFGVLDIGEGMLPNIIYIESALAENLFFQSEDLDASQTQTYIPEHQVYEINVGGPSIDVYDKYTRKTIIKGGIDKGEVVSSVQGHSAIGTIERNLALNVIQACLDAKINPISIGYVLTDKMGSNTDVGFDKERASIRLRETHVDKIKPFVAKEMEKRLGLEGINISYEDISVIFAQYITPTIETLTNTISKQVQFGLVSIETAVRKINKDILSEEEVQEEVERIKEQIVQIDLNMAQRLDSKTQGVDNRLKSEGVVE